MRAGSRVSRGIEDAIAAPERKLTAELQDDAVLAPLRTTWHKELDPKRRSSSATPTLALRISDGGGSSYSLRIRSLQSRLSLEDCFFGHHN